MMNRFGGGMGGGMGNMQALMRQAQKMQEEMVAKKAEIEASEFNGSSGGGMVECVMTGAKELKSVKLKPEIVDPDDIEMLEDLIVASVNDAIAKIKAAEKEQLPNMPI